MKNLPTRKTADRWMTSFGIVLASFALACGMTQSGGSDGDQLAEGGIGGTGYTQGPITDFGSIFVNGIEWFLNAAEIVFDGVAGVEADLRIGMVVRVEGEIDREAGTGEATRVYFDDDLEGPVESIEEVGDTGLIKELTILGMKVWIEDGRTRFDDDEGANPGFGFDTIAVDDLVEVSGLIDAAGVIRATHVEYEGELVLGTSEVELRGEVENYNGTDRFEIGDIEVRFDGTTELEDLPGGIANGLFVEVEGVLEAVDRVFAHEIEREDEIDDDDRDDFYISGYITEFTSESDFVVAGYTVDATLAEYENGNPTLLEVGVWIEVEGELTGGVVQASEIEFEGLEVAVAAAIAEPADIDVAGGMFVLLGVEIVITASTELEDDVHGVEPLTLGDLAADDFIRAKGVSDGAGRLIASEVKRREVEDVELQGPLDAISADEYVVLGQPIPITSATRFELDDVEVDRSVFEAAVGIGDRVDVSDEEDGDPSAIDFANRIENESDD